MPGASLSLAIIFDFIADDETIHFLPFQRALEEHGLGLFKEEYYGRYGGMDERLCTTARILADWTRRRHSGGHCRRHEGMAVARRRIRRPC